MTSELFELGEYVEVYHTNPDGSTIHAFGRVCSIGADNPRSYEILLNEYWPGAYYAKDLSRWNSDKYGRTASEMLKLPTMGKFISREIGQLF